MSQTSLTNPTIDIIVPVYNTARYLDQCVSSIVNQTLSSWRLILVDDGSTDDSPAICDRWATLDPRISVIHKPNTGQGDSRNVAIRRSTADYVGFVDSDDWIEPDMYSALLDAVRTHDADIAICAHYNDYPNKSVYKKGKRPDTETFSHDAVHRLIIHDRIQSYIWQMLFRRTCLEGSMPGHICFEDYAVLPRWYDKAKSVVRINRPLYHYRARKSSIVHVDSAAREMAMTEAEEQRMEYYRTTPLARLAYRRLIHTYIQTAKHIARIPQIPVITKLKNLEHIRQKLEAQGESSTMGLKKKDRLLRFLLLKSIPFFIIYQKAEIRLLGKKKGKKKEEMFK